MRGKELQRLLTSLGKKEEQAKLFRHGGVVLIITL